MTFYPWRGAKYGTPKSAFGIRILLMGESTYFSAADKECPKELYLAQRERIGAAWFAHYGVYAYRQGKWNDPFWTKVTSALLGRRVESLTDRRLVLDSIAFWNYGDPEPLEAHSMEVPGQDLGVANLKLRRVINELRPQLVILLSKRLWNNLGVGEGAIEGCSPAKTGEHCAQKIAGDEVDFLCLPHTRGFKYSEIYPAVREAIGGRFACGETADMAAPTRRKATIYHIKVYRHYGAWCFDDETVGFQCQPFVHGITQMMDSLSQTFSGPSERFDLYYSAKELPQGSTAVLTLLPGRYRGMRRYAMDGKPLKSWLCGDLKRYFAEPPEKIYCRLAPEAG